MNIFIPFATRDIGGPSSFVKKFASGMEKRGHTVTFQETETYDVLFVIVQAPFSLLWKAKRAGKPIIQRLDGVYYWSVSGWKFPFLNAKAFLIRHLFTDYTIYQSQYSKHCSEIFLGKKRNDPHAIIYNGVDTELFSPEGSKELVRDFPEQKIFFTASEFRRKDQLFPILEALVLYEREHPGSFKLLVAGSFNRELQGLEAELTKYPWFQFLGKIPNAELPKYERASDIFLFTHLNPPCPNNIIEALSCGLPICGIADGAMPELVRSGKEGLLLPAPGNAYWRRRKYDIPAFVRQIETLLKSPIPFSDESRGKALQTFTLEKMIERYEKVFYSLLT